MRTRVIAQILLLTFAPIAMNVPAFAQVDDEVTKEARDRFKEGVALYDKGQFESARLKFTQAYALKKHPAVLLNLAQSNLKSSHPLEASRLFQQYLREGTTLTPEQKAEAEKGLADAKAKLGKVEVSGPAGTEVFLESDRLGVLPINEAVDAEVGARTLKGTKDGNTETVKVTVAAGAKVQAKFGEKSATPLPPPVAVVPIAPAPTAPAAAPPAAPPANTTPADTGTQTFSAKNLLKPPKNMLPVYIGGGVGATGLLLSVVFLIAKGSAEDSQKTVGDDIRTKADQRGFKNGKDSTGAGVCVSTQPGAEAFKAACATYQDNVDKVNTDATLGNVSLVVGILGLATAAGWYMFAPKKDPAAARPLITPYYTGTEQGVNVVGRF